MSTKITAKLLLSKGFEKQGKLFIIPLHKKRSSYLSFWVEESSIYLHIVYHSFIRKVSSFEQIEAVYKSITDKNLPKTKSA